MFTSKKSLLLALTSAICLFSASSSEAGWGRFKPHFPRPSFRPAFSFPVPCPPPLPCPPPVHVHYYTVVAEQVWVPPVYSTVCVGYQPCGTPIYNQVCTNAGYYRTVYRHVCNCGASY